MAIVFISPRESQKVVFWGTTTLLIFFLVIVAGVVFLPDIFKKDQGEEVIVDPAGIVIDLEFLHSPEVSNLQPFTIISSQFSYAAKDQDGKTTSGTISATNLDEARRILEESGLSVSTIEEVRVTAGRSEPFISY